MEARLDAIEPLIANTHHHVLIASQELADIHSVLSDISARPIVSRADLEASLLSQTEALTFLSRSLQDFSRRLTALEARSAS